VRGLARELQDFENVAIACSFQKEEAVLLDLVLPIVPEARVFTIDTGVLFPETLATWRAFEAHFGVEIQTWDAFGAWTGPETCCGVAKVDALRRAIEGADCWVTGLRREQATTRADAEELEWDDKHGLWKANPLAAWTEKDIWSHIHERELPYNPLHDRGYSSIGCSPCTLPGNGREGRWAGTEKTECGLHV
jgi:phosphoadenosine phosphosulfate reductase